MIAVREVVRHEVVEIPTVDSMEEAKRLYTLIKDGYFNGKRAQEDAANGLVEAYFVTNLRSVPKNGDALKNAIRDLRAAFPESAIAERAIARVKAFRSKNRAFR